MPKVILMLGIPAGIQNAIFAMANLFIQTGVNSFSAVIVSGNAARVMQISLYIMLCGFLYCVLKLYGTEYGSV